jgi:hypothetical protein
MIGPFTFQGTYDNDRSVVLVKHYRRHNVQYNGNYDGEATVFGEWSIDGFWRGKFALTPEEFTAPANVQIQEISATPYVRQSA